MQHREFDVTADYSEKTANREQIVSGPTPAARRAFLVEDMLHAPPHSRLIGSPCPLPRGASTAR